MEIQVGLHNDATNDRLVFDSQSLMTSIEAMGLSEVSTATKEGAQMNLGVLDGAINRINENRSTLGALQNRLQSTINNLNIYKENLDSANSRIRDTDMAEETSDLVKYNILTQSNVAMLSQANQNPQLALKLL